MAILTLHPRRREALQSARGGVLVVRELSRSLLDWWEFSDIHQQDRKDLCTLTHGSLSLALGLRLVVHYSHVNDDIILQATTSVLPQTVRNVCMHVHVPLFFTSPSQNFHRVMVVPQTWVGRSVCLFRV